MNWGRTLDPFNIGYGNIFNSMMHPEKGYQDAQQQMEEKWKQAQGFEQPYNQAGIDQTGRLNQAENNLLDPSKMLADWMSKYQMSPYAQQSMANAREAGLNSASSMGLMGSSAAMNNMQKSAGDIMNADRQQYLNDLMDKYKTGIGIGQNIYNTGAGMAGQMGNQAISVGGNTADMAYGRANAPGKMGLDIAAMIAKMMMGKG